MKTKSLFDHLRAIYENQSPSYYDDLSDADRKTYSTYMINRLISMNANQTEVVNMFQTYYDVVTDRESYLFYSQLLPKGKQWNKYIKASKSPKYEDWVLNIVCIHYNVSQLEAERYLKIYLSSDDGKEALVSLLESYGSDPKKIRKVVK